MAPAARRPCHAYASLLLVLATMTRAEMLRDCDELTKMRQDLQEQDKWCFDIHYMAVRP